MVVKTLGQATFCAVDVETTGLYRNSRLVEIGAIKFDCKVRNEEFHTLVDPGEPIPEDAVAYHGITNDMVSGYPSPSDSVRRFARFLGDAVFIAHNARFDVRILAMEYAHAGIKQPGNHVIDTLELAGTLFPRMQDYKLESLVRRLKIKRDCMHRGLPDALAVREIFRAYLQKALKSSRVTDTPGYIGRFNELAPDMEVDLQGDLSDIPLLAEKRIMVEIIYRGGTQPMVPRPVTPISIQAKGAREYLVAYCHSSGCTKTFRLDRVIEYRLMQ